MKNKDFLGMMNDIVDADADVRKYTTYLI